jgi:hypothetical protein
VARAASYQPLTEERITDRVTRTALPDGSVAAVKRAAPNAPVTREATVLRYLRSRGCAVPDVLEADEERLVTAWCGERTLDDALQEGRRVSGATLIQAVSGVGRALSVAAPRSPASRDALVAQVALWAEALPGALVWLSGAAHERLVAAVLDRAAACEPEVGSLDYTARNVLVDASGERVWLIDFAATGFDWTERRLAQYALASGAGRRGGVFLSALSAEDCSSHGDPTGLDAHEVVLLLTAAEHLRQVEAGQSHPDRASAWANVAERRASLLRLLRRPLAGYGPAAELRAATA